MPNSVALCACLGLEGREYPAIPTSSPLTKAPSTPSATRSSNQLAGFAASTPASEANDRLRRDHAAPLIAISTAPIF